MINKELIEIRANVLKGIREYLNGKGFLEVTTPTIVGATGACENAPTVFSLEYFGQRAFLIQTCQLHLEAYLYSGLSRVYSINQSFRAERRITSRHLCEFTLAEFEGKGIDLEELMDLEEGLVKHVYHLCLDNRLTSFERMAYDNAISFLIAKGLNITWGDDLSSEAEQIICGEYGPVFVTDYPESIKFFNMKIKRDNEKVVECVDLLLPGVGETIGGSVRESEYDRMKKRLEESTMLAQLLEMGGRRDDFDWYLDLLKEKNIERSGCGIGVDRLVQFIVEAHSVKDCVGFVRDAQCLIP